MVYFKISPSAYCISIFNQWHSSMGFIFCSVNFIFSPEMSWDCFAFVKISIVFDHDLAHHRPESASFLFTNQGTILVNAIDVVLKISHLGESPWTPVAPQQLLEMRVVHMVVHADSCPGRLQVWSLALIST